jgi:putative N6-adenine-specific DNA methylase
MDLAERKTVRVTCAPGLAPYLQRELESLGYRVREPQSTSIELHASLLDAMRLNLHLRTAFNVLYLLKEFRCKTVEKLYQRTVAHPWEELIAPHEYLSVVSRVDTPAIDNWTYASLKIKDAIVDRIAEKTGRRPDSGPLRDNVVVNVYWIKDDCKIFLNTSGRKLADRGYRRIPHTAPMQETLSAAVMLETGYDGSRPLVTPMCGSGTLAIEAALIATGRSPGLLRGNFGFMHTLAFDDTAWQELRREAQKQRAKAPPAPIIATDIDERAVTAARKNAMTAGVDRLIRFAVCDFADTPVPPGPGIVVINPEYGERLGEIAALEETYARIGDFYKQKCAGYTGYIFTGNLDLAKKVGLRAARRFPFFNAKIECRLLKYDLYEGSR